MARVLVVGGGPAGLYASIKSAGSGFNTTLLERDKIGGDIRCAEGFFDVMKLLGKPKAGVRFKVDKIIIRAKSTYYFDARRLYLWMIDRQTWQRELAKTARQKGVKIEENTSISPCELKDAQKRYDYIIDASGAPSVTSRLYGFSEFYRENSAKTVQYVAKGDFSYLGKNLKAGLIPELWGYYWVFPKGVDDDGRHTANIGVGNFNPSSRISLWGLLEYALRREGIDRESIDIIKTFGGICPTRMPDKLVYDNILLAGDAAGLTSPLHGGGIDMAAISGIYAARALKEGVQTYDKNLRGLLKERLQFENLLAQVWAKKNFDEMDRLINKVSHYKINKVFFNPKFMNKLLMSRIQSLLK
ncbi:MAG: NAD(P)/FAD-dependent oxidoreductase [Tepidanaerobacteraceae bacterium]